MGSLYGSSATTSEMYFVTLVLPLLLSQAFLFTPRDTVQRNTRDTVCNALTVKCMRHEEARQRRGEEVRSRERFLHLLVVDLWGRSSRAKMPGALEAEENCTCGDTPENESRAP